MLAKLYYDLIHCVSTNFLRVFKSNSYENLADHVANLYSTLDWAHTTIHFLQQDGFSPQWDVPGRVYMENKFPGKWIGREGPLPLSPRFLDITTLEYSQLHAPQNMVIAWILTGHLLCNQGGQYLGVLRPVRSLRSLTSTQRMVHVSSSFFSEPRCCETPAELRGHTVYHFWHGLDLS